MKSFIKSQMKVNLKLLQNLKRFLLSIYNKSFSKANNFYSFYYSYDDNQFNSLSPSYDDQLQCPHKSFVWQAFLHGWMPIIWIWIYWKLLCSCSSLPRTTLANALSFQYTTQWFHLHRMPKTLASLWTKTNHSQDMIPPAEHLQSCTFLTREAIEIQAEALVCSCLDSSHLTHPTEHLQLHFTLQIVSK